VEALCPPFFRRTIHGEYTERTDNIATSKTLIPATYILLRFYLGNLLRKTTSNEVPPTSTSDLESADKAGDGDTALALFNNPDELHKAIDPRQERALQRKIDFMILPYLAVCSAFFYIDKTTLSYAAIFGIQSDLHLVGTQYSWLSSIFYFGFLIWAC
jgi:hypothetical protein